MMRLFGVSGRFAGIQRLPNFTGATVQEFCNGGSLRQLLSRGYMAPRRLQRRWLALIGILRGIVEGMEYVHSKRICHGDLNPNNVLLKVCPFEPSGSFHAQQAHLPR